MEKKRSLWQNGFKNPLLCSPQSCVTPRVLEFQIHFSNLLCQNHKTRKKKEEKDGKDIHNLEMSGKVTHMNNKMST